MTTFRIHGDNIVECERIAKIIINTIKPKEIRTYLLAPSTMAIELKTVFLNTHINWQLILLPGFNKNTKRRWEANIFDALREAGSYFDETPDAIISKINDNKTESIILGIEFCSALQAGNQAWQRSARAFSTGRTGCPYIYIVDFVKYELNNKTRERKNLRFPNAAIPYSYVNFSKNTGNFVAQLYIKSEEFDKNKDKALNDFSEDDFGSTDLGIYIVKLLLGCNTSAEENTILRKNMNVVRFLAKNTDHKKNFTDTEWQNIYELKCNNIIDYAIEKNRFIFHKTIASKSHHGQSQNIVKLIDKLSIGLASRDLPFGIIPVSSRPIFAKQLSKLYPKFSANTIHEIETNKKHLLVALIKGFKPHGDDNRPDRGLLPLASMLSATDVDVLTFIYGPIIEGNLKLLDTTPQKLAAKNGLWRSILALSNYVLLDVPVLASQNYDAERLYNTSVLKNYYSNLGTGKTLQPKVAFSNTSVNFGEDDVDTAIHYLFTHILGKYCFEGMCNPPGGDWSGFSVLDCGYENRWLSLPRESDIVDGKRPDHILELFKVFKKPLLLSIESKEKSVDLETDVGTKLITYIKKLMNFVPSAQRNLDTKKIEWTWGEKKVDFNNFETISAAAYLKKYAEPSGEVFKKNCEILFVMAPLMENKIGWEIDIIPSTPRSKILKKFIIEKYRTSGDNQFILK